MQGSSLDLILHFFYTFFFEYLAMNTSKIDTYNFDGLEI